MVIDDSLNSVRNIKQTNANDINDLKKQKNIAPHLSSFKELLKKRFESNVKTSVWGNT